MVRYTKSIDTELGTFYTSWLADKKISVSELETSYKAMVEAERIYKTKRNEAAADTGNQTKQKAAATAQEEYNKALLAYQSNFNYNQSKGYITNDKFSETANVDNMYSESGLEAATREIEVDKSKRWFLRDPYGGVGYSVVSDENQRIVDEKELGEITNAFGKNGNAVVWYPNNNGDLGVKKDDIPDKDVGNINTWAGLHPEAIIKYGNNQ